MFHVWSPCLNTKRHTYFCFFLFSQQNPWSCIAVKRDFFIPVEIKLSKLEEAFETSISAPQGCLLPFWIEVSISLYHWWISHGGPKGHPNYLPQPAWCLTELFFWSDLSWLRADLCANSYVISTRFSLLSMLPSCTHYISYVGILRVIHNILFRIIHLYDIELGPTDFQLTCYCSHFSIFE